MRGSSTQRTANSNNDALLKDQKTLVVQKNNSRLNESMTRKLQKGTNATGSGDLHGSGRTGDFNGLSKR